MGSMGLFNYKTMNILQILSSIILGSTIGILYGLFFMHQKKQILAMNNQDSAVPTFKKTILRSLLSIIRLAFLSILWLFLLRSTSFLFILVLPCFLISFWLILLKQKARLNERH